MTATLEAPVAATPIMVPRVTMEPREPRPEPVGTGELGAMLNQLIQQQQFAFMGLVASSQNRRQVVRRGGQFLDQ